MPDMPNIDLKERNNFAYFTNVTTRYSDQDELGHINNCSYVTYVEAGRVQFLGGLLDPNRHPGIDLILARVTVNYLRESHYPGIMEVGSRILELGSKSITTGYGLFKDGHWWRRREHFEVGSRNTIEIPTDIRAALEADPTQADRASVTLIGLNQKRVRFGGIGFALSKADIVSAGDDHHGPVHVRALRSPRKRPTRIVAETIE